MCLFYLLCLAISPLLLAAETIVVKTKAPIFIDYEDLRKGIVE